MSDAGHGHSAGGPANPWTDAQSSQITSLYESLHEDYQKLAHQKLFGGKQLEYTQAHELLNALLEEQNHAGGLESKVEGHSGSSHKSSAGNLNLDYLIGIAGAGVAAVGIAAGAPFVGILGAIVAAYSLIPKSGNAKKAEAN